MVKKVKLGKEIAVIGGSKPGVLATVASILAARGIDVVALSAQVAGGVGLINMVTDDNLRACDLLRKKKIQFRENPVVLLEVEDKPGVLKRIGTALGKKKINVYNIYGSTTDSYSTCLLVISTDSNAKALVALRRLK